MIGAVWVVLGVAALIVLAILGYAAWYAYRIRQSQKALAAVHRMTRDDVARRGVHP